MKSPLCIDSLHRFCCIDIVGDGRWRDAGSSPAEPTQGSIRS